MAYQRKTRDEFHLEGNYGYGDGWELLCAESTMREARERRAEYVANEGGNYRIRARRVRIEQEA